MKQLKTAGSHVCMCPCVTPGIACLCLAGGLEEREDQLPTSAHFSIKMLVLRWTLK